MAHLIDKDALVAEIELLKEELQDKVETSDFIAGEVFIMNYFLSFLDTLEVKEADEEPVSKDYRERYKRIAQSESFKEAYDGKSISEEEPVSIDFEKELYKAFGQVKDFTLGMRIAKWFYDMGKNSQKSVSEDLETDIAIRLGGVCHKQVWHKNHFSKEDCKAYCSLYKECQECSIDLCMIFFHDPHCHFEEDPVSEDLENAGKEWLRPQLDKYYKPYGEGKMMELTRFDGYAMLDAIEFGAKWQKEKDQKK